MNNSIFRFGLIAFLLGQFFYSNAQNYSIQLCAFTEAVSPSYFHYAGFDGVQQQKDYLPFQNYYYGNYSSLAAAKKQFESIKEKGKLAGWEHMKIIQNDVNNVPFLFKNKINKTPDYQLFNRVVSVDELTLSLEKETAELLENIVLILKNNPQLKLRIIGESNALNQSNTCDIVEHFMLANHIPAFRLKILLLNQNQSNAPLAKTKVLLTLVDLKEEIVLDRFSLEKLLVKS
jgi:hypothetical protein